MSGDSGRGATFGSFEGQTAGLGPVLSYAGRAWGHAVVGELKWLAELDTKNQLQGDYIWLKLVAKF